MFRRYGLLNLTLAALAGCADIAPPRILHPGRVEDQQLRAQKFDPYPMTDVAPEVAGGRPLQYIKPAPETERMQNDGTFTDRFGQPAPPGTYKPPRGIGNRQPIVYPPPAELQIAPPFTPP